jgi:hypothetical protein
MTKPDPKQAGSVWLTGEMKRLLDVVHKLPLELREVWVLRYLEARSLEQMSQCLGCSEHAVNRRLERACALVNRELGSNIIWRQFGVRPRFLSGLIASYLEQGILQRNRAHVAARHRAEAIQPKESAQ